MFDAAVHNFFALFVYFIFYGYLLVFFNYLVCSIDLSYLD